MSEKISVNFPVLSPHGDMEFSFDLTEKELDQLQEAEESEEAFCDIESLQELYTRVLDAAYDEIANYIYDNDDIINTHLGGTYDFAKAREYAVENYDIEIDYPIVEEDPK